MSKAMCIILEVLSTLAVTPMATCGFGAAQPQPEDDIAEQGEPEPIDPPALPTEAPIEPPTEAPMATSRPKPSVPTQANWTGTRTSPINRVAMRRP